MYSGSRSLLGRWLIYSSSTQSAGVGGMLPSPVPINGGGRARVRLGPWDVLAEDDSDEPLTLTDLPAGGGPGGGGGRGIPGSQPFAGDGPRDRLEGLEELALLTTAPAEAALRDAGGLDSASNWPAEGPAPLPRNAGDGRGCSNEFNAIRDCEFGGTAL
jgi:hypothetical protein